MEHTSNIVAEGKLIGKNSYSDRAARYIELQLDGVKIDYYDAKNKVVHEVKRSNKMEAAHEAQVKYYLYKLMQVGIEGAKGILEYPALRHTLQVNLTNEDLEKIYQWENEIENIIQNKQIPPVLHKQVCKKCSYYDFCYC